MDLLLSKSSLFDILSMKGYKILRTISVKGDQDESVKYLKAYDDSGIGVYILIDIENVIEISTEGRFTVKKYEGENKLFSSSDISSLEKLPEISGMAFECQDELCLMERQNDRSISTPSFKVYDPSDTPRFISLEEGVVAYPLIRVSEILTDLEGTKQRTQETSNFIYERNFNMAVRESRELIEKLISLPRAFDSFTTASREMTEKLNIQIQFILELIPLSSEENKEDLRMNVFMRNHLIEKNLSLQKKIYGLSSKFTAVFKELDEKMYALMKMNKMIGSSTDPTIVGSEDSVTLLKM